MTSWEAFRRVHASLYSNDILHSGYWPYLVPQPVWDDERLRFL